jgi:hypothetical protein
MKRPVFPSNVVDDTGLSLLHQIRLSILHVPSDSGGRIVVAMKACVELWTYPVEDKSIVDRYLGRVERLRQRTLKLDEKYENCNVQAPCEHHFSR